jgi:hypothetical protein
MASSALLDRHLCDLYSADYVPPETTRAKPSLPAGVVPASRLEIRPAAAMALTGISSIDDLAGGLPRGALSEIFGPPTS